MKAYVMDAFSEKLFGGNQAGVALPECPLSDAVMQHRGGIQAFGNGLCDRQRRRQRDASVFHPRR